jgi:glycosyltransferase involved in cell wall biosynthesis
VYELSSELVRRGHSVDVYTSNETRTSGRLQAYSEIDGIRVYRFPSLASLGEFGKVWPSFAAEIMGKDYDVMHSHVYRHPHTDLTAAVSKFKKTRSVMTAHSPFHPSGTRGPLANALVSVYDRVLAPFSLRAFDWLVSLTPSEVEHLVALGARRDRMSVIPHGIGPENFVHSKSSRFLGKFGLEEGAYALYLGRVHPTKGLDTLLEAFARFSPEAPGFKLVMAGPTTSPIEEEFNVRLRQRAEKLGVAGKVLLTGQLSEDEKLGAYESCRFFVLPSLYEPYGIVLLEAAAHRKPLVSTLSDGPASIIEDGVSGFLLRPGDIEGFASRMKRLALDDALAQTMSEKAHEMALQHTWKRVATEVEGTYFPRPAA